MFLKIVCPFIVLSGQSSDSPVGPQSLQGRAQVTVSLPGTLNACGEDVRLLVNPLRLTEKQTSEKQEPNISHGLFCLRLSRFRETVVLHRKKGVVVLEKAARPLIVMFRAILRPRHQRVS